MRAPVRCTRRVARNVGIGALALGYSRRERDASTRRRAPRSAKGGLGRVGAGLGSAGGRAWQGDARVRSATCWAKARWRARVSCTSCMRAVAWA